MPFAALSQRARARKAAQLRRLRPAFFCPRQRQAAIPCGNAVQRRKTRSRTTTGWIKGGEKSPPLPFQLGGIQIGGIQRGEEIGIFPPLACFLFLSTFSWARGHERLPPVSALFRGFLSRLACWASAQRRSLGATIPRKMSAHRCCTVFTEQICDESRRRPRIILSYSQGLQRRVGANLPAKTDRGSSPLAPARAKRKWTPTE